MRAESLLVGVSEAWLLAVWDSFFPEGDIIAVWKCGYSPEGDGHNILTSVVGFEMWRHQSRRLYY